jgi:hypothetical protein
MKSRLSSILLLIVALALLAGCGDDGEETTTTTATALEETTTEADTTSTGPGTPQGSEGGDDELAEEAAPPAGVQVERGAEAFLVSPDTDLVCRKLLTENAVKESYGSTSACLQSRPKPTLAKSVEVAKPDVGEAEATVTATPDGGLYDGVEVEFAFVAEDETWLIDSVSADIPVGP